MAHLLSLASDATLSLAARAAAAAAASTTAAAKKDDTPTAWYQPFINPESEELFHSRVKPCKLKPAQCAIMNNWWYSFQVSDLAYGLPTIYFLLAILGLFIAANIVSRLAPARLSQFSLWRRCLSVVRYLSYKQFRLGSSRFSTPPVGAMLLLGAGLVYFLSMILAPGQYYWPTDASYGNSPPVSTRISWLILACLPFVLALGAKASIVTVLTGISHEKLNFYHAWLGRAMWVMALAHMAPYVIFRTNKGDVHTAWINKGTWLAGSLALISLTYITFMSPSFIRNRAYEFFKFGHFFFGLSFIVFLTIHCTFALTSWIFIISALSIYAACVLYSIAQTLFRHGINRTARLRLETPHTLRISIASETNWGPGSHFFIRFLTSVGPHALTAHPFTVCTLPGGKEGEMAFFVQPRGGLTRRLGALAAKRPDASVRILLDGPYGGLPARWSKGFDASLVVAGGSGCGFTLALLEQWVRNQAADPASIKTLDVILCTRDPEMRVWYSHELQRILRTNGYATLSDVPGLSVMLHETYVAPGISSTSSPSLTSSDVEKSPAEKDTSVTMDMSCPTLGVSFFAGRPDLVQAVTARAARPSTTLGIAACGPASIISDVSSAAADVQGKILAGDESMASELWLHRESFSF